MGAKRKDLLLQDYLLWRNRCRNSKRTGEQRRDLSSVHQER